MTAAVLTDAPAGGGEAERPASRAADRPGGGLQVVLLLFALALGIGAQAAVSLALHGQVDGSITYPVVALGAVAVVGHVAVRLWAPYADPLVLPLVVVLEGLGLALINRIDQAPGVRTHYAPLQTLWTVVALVGFCLVLAVVRDHRVLTRYGYVCALAGIGLLLLPSVLPASVSEVNGARVWIRFAGFSLQPGEISKILLMVFFATFLVAQRDVLSVVTRSVLGLALPRARDLGPVVVAWLASLAVLVRENDLGQSLLLFGLFIGMLYVATERISWVAIGVSLFLLGAVAAWRTSAKVQLRVDIWLHPFSGTNPTDKAYQLVQGLFGMASGGLVGTGLGRGRPQIVPFSRTDFIVAALGEELGLVGIVAMLTLFLLLCSRFLRAGLAVRDSFGKLFAGGVAIAIALQVFVVVGGVMRLIPLTGLTTPFLSYGGSSLLANFVLVALVLRISDAARRDAAEGVREVPAERRLA